MKNKIINHWGIIVSSVLSFFGVFVGGFACAYGPPTEEEMHKAQMLEAEVQELEIKLDKEKDEISRIQRDIDKYKHEIKSLENEKAYILNLLKEFDK